MLRTVLDQEIETFVKTSDGGQDGTFCGEWNPSKGGIPGTGTVQCKFTASRDSRITVGQLADELSKAKVLAKEGRAKNYILITNASVTAPTRNAIDRKFRSIKGIESFQLYGRQWLTDQISGSDHLRMLVPRVYGLGDLTQILDQRRRDQARALLDEHDDNIRTFVITRAHRDSVKAISETGFVLLLGDPATGKTSIATALALGSIDRWHCVPTKVTSGQEFRDSWNPHEKQFFWVDDAFGTTQYQSAYADEWVRTFPFIQTALKRGTRIVFTSRTYIYQAALRDLKTSEFYLLRDSKVLIEVERYSKQEREAILYNHLRLGNQSEPFKKALLDRGLLDLVVAHPRFTPVVARRLSSATYTKNLELTAESLNHFIEDQGDYIRDVILELDRASYAGLSFIFMSGGALKSPVPQEPRYVKTARSLNTNLGAASTALKAMNKGLVRHLVDGGNFTWRFDHPSIGDALASILTTDVEQLDIYLQGARPEQIAQEVTCIGREVRGAVKIPQSQYDLLLKRLLLLGNRWPAFQQLKTFLLERADKEFLVKYLRADPDLPSRLALDAGYSLTVEGRLLARMHQLKLVPESNRIAAVAVIKRRAVDSLNTDFLRRSVGLLTDSERDEILKAIRHQALPNIGDIIDDVEGDYEAPADPEEHFADLVSSLDDLRSAFSHDAEAKHLINEAQYEIEQRVEQLESEMPEERTSDEDELDDEDRTPAAADADDRDFFSDVYVPI